jgi:hypothetical protein
MLMQFFTKMYSEMLCGGAKVFLHIGDDEEATATSTLVRRPDTGVSKVACRGWREFAAAMNMRVDEVYILAISTLVEDEVLLLRAIYAPNVA